MKNSALFLFDQPWNKDAICNKNAIRIKYWKKIPSEIEKITMGY